MSLILVIDDDLAMRALMARLAESAGHEVVLAEGAYEGLQTFFRIAPDLVITDLSMPDGDGAPLIAEIRRFSPDAKIMAVSGKLTPNDGDRSGDGSELEVNAVLGKPFRAREFCETIGDLLA